MALRLCVHNSSISVFVFFFCFFYFCFYLWRNFVFLPPWPRSKQEGSSGARRDLRLLKVNYVKDVTLLGQSEDLFELKNPYLDMASLRNREEAAIRYLFSSSLYSWIKFLPIFWETYFGLSSVRNGLRSTWSIHDCTSPLYPTLWFTRPSWNRAAGIRFCYSIHIQYWFQGKQHAPPDHYQRVLVMRSSEWKPSFHFRIEIQHQEYEIQSRILAMLAC